MTLAKGSMHTAPSLQWEPEAAGVPTSAIADCNALATSDTAILSAARANASAVLCASVFSGASTTIAGAPSEVTIFPLGPAFSGLSTSSVAAAFSTPSTMSCDAVAAFSAPFGAVTDSSSMSPVRSAAASVAGGPFPGDSTGLWSGRVVLDPVGGNRVEVAQL